MTNWYENLIYLIRNTSLTPAAIDELSWYEFEMFLATLKTTLEAEAEQRKKEQERQERQAKKSSSPFKSMGSQMRSWFSKRK